MDSGSLGGSGCGEVGTALVLLLALVLGRCPGLDLGLGLVLVLVLYLGLGLARRLALGSGPVQPVSTSTTLNI